MARATNLFTSWTCEKDKGYGYSTYENNHFLKIHYKQEKEKEK